MGIVSYAYCTLWPKEDTPQPLLVSFLSVTNTVRKSGLVLVYSLSIYTILEENAWQGGMRHCTLSQ